MLRLPFVVFLATACLLSCPAISSAEETDSLVKAGDLVRAAQFGDQSAMWSVFIFPKDTKLPKDAEIPDASIYKVKVFNERGLFLVSVNKDGAQKRYEIMIPWHAIVVIRRETDEPVDVPK